MFFSDFGNRLKLLRKNLKVNQGVFAKKLGISTRTLATWENEESHPAENKLHFIAKTLNVNSAWLANGSGEKNANFLSNVDDEILLNSIELRIRRMIESKLNHFQHEIILMYHALNASTPKNVNDLITILTNYKIVLIHDKFFHNISEADRISSLHFISTLSDVEKDCIIRHLEHYRRILWDCIDWMNRFFNKAP
jgi:transcriptional regulator with XRE-family HTH domain